ncbi:MAG: Uncharacterized protein Greene071421_552 [Parcubacteria group bacterium Greene0714_21]|nr:MAG: Uncharacterized protein Greene101447_585 [Parcubacteria group bacterium Greene1014_47]TSD03852.1 MAG: Uncharacterized protein Greene071421_552 [Parcubacteria group bacterium Greene0714_21]
MEERNNQLFVDSNYFIALFNERDTLAQKARSISEELDIRPTTLVISSLVFLEIVTITSMRAGRKIAKEAGASLLSRQDIRVIHVDEAIQNEAWNIFQETEEKNISFVDCSIIAAMKAEDISTLLTFDRADFTALQKQYRFSLYKI